MSDKKPKKIDLNNIDDADLDNLDALVKKLAEREKNRLTDPTSHTSDHSSSHRSDP